MTSFSKTFENHAVYPFHVISRAMTVTSWFGLGQTNNPKQHPATRFPFQISTKRLHPQQPTTSYLNSSRLNETIETITVSHGFTKRETECRRHRSLPRAWCQPRPKSSDHRKDPGISRHRCSNMLSHPNLSTINDKWFNILWVKTLAPCREPQVIAGIYGCSSH